MTFFGISTHRFTTSFFFSKYLLLPITSTFQFLRNVVPHAVFFHFYETLQNPTLIFLLFPQFFQKRLTFHPKVFLFLATRCFARPFLLRLRKASMFTRAGSLSHASFTCSTHPSLLSTSLHLSLLLTMLRLHLSTTHVRHSAKAPSSRCSSSLRLDRFSKSKDSRCGRNPPTPGQAQVTRDFRRVKARFGNPQVLVHIRSDSRLFSPHLAQVGSVRSRLRSRRFLAASST